MQNPKETKSIKGKVILGLIGGTIGIIAIPLTLTTIGFGPGGIVAGSWASNMMSSTMIANGGTLAAGGYIPMGQSMGAAGVSFATYLGAGGVFSSIGVGIGEIVDKIKKKAKKVHVPKL